MAGRQPGYYNSLKSERDRWSALRLRGKMTESIHAPDPVLVVEDDPTVRKVLSRHLTRAPILVIMLTAALGSPRA